LKGIEKIPSGIALKRRSELNCVQFWKINETGAACDSPILKYPCHHSRHEELMQAGGGGCDGGGGGGGAKAAAAAAKERYRIIVLPGLQYIKG
jgi:hypothetical protein